METHVHLSTRIQTWNPDYDTGFLTEVKQIDPYPSSVFFQHQNNSANLKPLKKRRRKYNYKRTAPPLSDPTQEMKRQNVIKYYERQCKIRQTILNKCFAHICLTCDNDNGDDSFLVTFHIMTGSGYNSGNLVKRIKKGEKMCLSKNIYPPPLAFENMPKRRQRKHKYDHSLPINPNEEGATKKLQARRQYRQRWKQFEMRHEPTIFKFYCEL